MTEPTSTQDLFRGRHFDQEIIILCIRWYLTFKLSSRDLVQMMAERGIALAHTTILRWVQRYVPDFEKRWNQHARPVGDSWRVDETYIKIKGQWMYLYRAVDKAGRTVDFLLSKRRDVAAAQGFFSRAIPAAWGTEGDHLGQLRRLPSGGGQTQSGWHPSALRAHPIEQVFEQRGGTGSSPDKTRLRPSARVEALRDGGRDDSGHRVSGENQETTIQPQTPNWKSRHRSRIMGRSPGGLKSEKPLARQKHIPKKFAPEP